MESISAERRAQLLAAVKVSRWKLELLDRYGVDTAHRADQDRLGKVRAAAVAETSALADAGIEMRRIKTISEPPSDYMRGAYDFSSHLVEAGEDIRWLPRHRASALLLPGNDMFVLDGKSVMFNVHDGDTNPAGQQWADDPALVARCREVFEAAWAAAIPHRDYTLA